MKHTGIQHGKLLKVKLNCLVVDNLRLVVFVVYLDFKKEGIFKHAE